MKLTTTKAALLSTLIRTVPLTEARTTLPILTHVLMTARDGDTLSLSANNLESYCEASCAATIETDGMMCLPGRKLLEIVKTLGDDDITIETTEHRTKITAGAASFTLATLSAEDFPVASAVENIEHIIIDCDAFLDALGSVDYAASSQESRFNMNAIYFEPNGGASRMVTTDGHRLALVHWRAQIGYKPILVPLAGVGVLVKALHGISGEVQVGCDEKNLVVTTENLTIAVRLIDSEFPDYRKVIPDPANIQANVPLNRNELLRAVRRVSVFTSDTNKGLRLAIVENLVELKTTHPDLGEGRDVVDVEYSGEPISLIVNSAYLLDALTTMTADRITAEYFGDGLPLIFRAVMENETPNEDLHLVMPMRK